MNTSRIAYIVKQIGINIVPYQEPTGQRKSNLVMYTSKGRCGVEQRIADPKLTEDALEMAVRICELFKAFIFYWVLGKKINRLVMKYPWWGPFLVHYTMAKCVRQGSWGGLSHQHILYTPALHPMRRDTSPQQWRQVPRLLWKDQIPAVQRPQVWRSATPSWPHLGKWLTKNPMTPNITYIYEINCWHKYVWMGETIHSRKKKDHFLKIKQMYIL